MSGYVNTVRGPIKITELGTTLMHEHLAELNNSMKRSYADWFDADIFLEKIKPVFKKILSCKHYQVFITTARWIREKRPCENDAA